MILSFPLLHLNRWMKWKKIKWNYSNSTFLLSKLVLEPHLLIDSIKSSLTVICVFGLPTVWWPEVGRLKPIECPVVLHRQHVIVYLKKIAVRGNQMSKVQGVRCERNSIRETLNCWFFLAFGLAFVLRTVPSLSYKTKRNSVKKTDISLIFVII